MIFLNGGDMHYYTHNIGDYRRDTAHLSLLEHGVYRQLIDQYYLNEKPIPEDLDKLKRLMGVRSNDEVIALEHVLDDFFIKTNAGYIHKRCDETIAEFRAKSDKASQAAKSRYANAVRTHSERSANHKPITINQEPIEEECPFFNEFWKAYPRKTKRKDTLKLWLKNKMGARELEIIKQALNWQTETKQWKMGIIPHPTTYLNQERWNDEPESLGF